MEVGAARPDDSQSVAERGAGAAERAERIGGQEGDAR